MQFRWPAAFLIFLGSYAPLSLILLVQDLSPWIWGSSPCNPFGGSASCSMAIFSHPLTSLSAVVVTVVSSMMGAAVLRRITFDYPVRIVEAKPIPNDLINYVFPYVVSFMGLSYADAGKLAGFTVFLLWMFLITYRSGQICMNPLLLVAGWQLYEARVHTERGDLTVRMLAKHGLEPGLVMGDMVQDFYFVGKAYGRDL